MVLPSNVMHPSPKARWHKISPPVLAEEMKTEFDCVTLLIQTCLTFCFYVFSPHKNVFLEQVVAPRSLTFCLGLLPHEISERDNV